jgi:molecular chaperone DnaK (HSP70)
VQVWTDDADVEIIANDQGNRVTPSYVAFTETERLIGDAAKNQAALNPRNTIFDAKFFSVMMKLIIDVSSVVDMMILMLPRTESNGPSQLSTMVRVHH